MKIIDLLNMTANDKADVYNTYFMFGDEKHNLYRFFDSYVLDFTSLNFEIEIIEDEEDKENKIPEKLQFEEGKISDNEFLAKYITHNRYKINEIIDYLKSKGDE